MVRKGLRAVSVLTALLFIFAMAGWAQSSNSTSNSSKGSKLSSSDRQFLKKAAEGGQAEVQLGQLAAQKAESQEVKNFGQRMANDHQKANEQLEKVAKNEGVNLPHTMDPDSIALKNRLDKLSGAQFDKAYMDAMVKDHTKDVQEFKQEASNGQDPEVKAFAQKTVPTLEEHLKLAKQIAPKEQAAK